MVSSPATHTASRAPSGSLSEGIAEKDQLRQFADQVTGLFVDLADLLGVPKSVAMIYGELFASPTPLCFAEIEERTGISKGSVSQGLRFLREIGAVREAGQIPQDPGRSRAVEHFEAVVELRALLLRLLTEKIQPQLDSGQARVADVVAAWQTLPEAPKQVLESRVEHLKIWPKRTREFLPLIRTFLSFGR